MKTAEQSMMKAARQSHRRRLVGLALIALSIVVSTGCATNPATGRSQLSFYSEAEEVQLGRSNDEQLVAQFGLYDDPELAAYVDRLGQNLAAVSERPALPWTFRVLDDPVVNAFALPGGFIYVTRGILAHMGSEAELAAVLGHEIGHVTARHGVNRLSKAQLANVGLGVGAVLAPEMAGGFGDLAQQGLQLLFLKYSRDDERQADDLGFRYADRVGQHPGGFVDVFAMLMASSSLGGGGRLPGYLQTHPDPEERLLTARQRLSRVPASSLDRPLGREALLEHLDGMPFGTNPREGFFVGTSFVHPDLAFRLELPEGWVGHNQKQALIAVSPENDAIIQLTLTDEASADAAARAFYGQQGITPRSAWRDDAGEAPRLEGTRLFQVGSGQQVIYGMAGFAEDDGRVYRLLAATEQDSWRSSSGVIERSLASFSKLRERRYLEVEPMTLELITVDRDMSLEEFDRRFPSSISRERLAMINQVLGGESLVRGQRAKRVLGFNPGPQTGVTLEPER
ncbi:MAG: M48 family metalloprotease [Acidobacteriota bacterium]